MSNHGEEVLLMRFQVPNGLLVMNIEDPKKPYPQAYFPTMGWPKEIRVDKPHILFASGRYGVYRFGLHESNLLKPGAD